MSTGAHLRYCDSAIPEEHLRKHKCDLFKFSTEDENGLLVHRSVAHKEQYNEELVAKEKLQMDKTRVRILGRSNSRVKKGKDQECKQRSR